MEDYGLSRVILSRELSLEEIEEIQQHVPDIELEVLYMVHYAWPTQAAVYFLIYEQA